MSFLQATVNRHMIDRHRLCKYNAMRPRTIDRPRQFPRVQCDGLLAEDVFARRERQHQIVDVRVVRRGDIDDVDIRIVKYILHPLIHLRNAIPRGKLLRLALCAVADGIQPASKRLHGARKFVADHAAAKCRPTISHL